MILKEFIEDHPFLTLLSIALAVGGTVFGVHNYFTDQAATLDRQLCQIEKERLELRIEDLGLKVENLERLVSDKETRIQGLRKTALAAEARLTELTNISRKLEVQSDFVQVDRNPIPTCDGSPQPTPVEVEGDDGLLNLSLLRTATATASSTLPGSGDRHRTEFLIDGWYNNCRSWVAGTMPANVTVDLGADYIVEAVRFGSDHSEYYSDRAAVQFSLLGATSKSPKAWETLREYNDVNNPISGTKTLSFSPQEIRYVRISIHAANLSEVRIDEIEVLGRAP